VQKPGTGLGRHLLRLLCGAALWVWPIQGALLQMPAGARNRSDENCFREVLDESAWNDLIRKWAVVLAHMTA